jgi:hypothetical protein
MGSSDTPPKLIRETVTDTIELVYGYTAREISIAWKLVGGTWHAIVHNRRGELSRGTVDVWTDKKGCKLREGKG